MNELETYNWLAKISEDISAKMIIVQEVLNEITALKDKQVSLQKSIGFITTTKDLSRTYQKQVMSETIADIRHNAVSVLKNINTWTSLRVIVDKVRQTFPDVKRVTIERQIRLLAHTIDSKVWSNGKKTKGSMYRWSEINPDERISYV